MFLFSYKNSYLGIDLGTSSIKIVELQNEKGRASLVTYGYVDQITDLIKSETKEGKAKIAAVFQKICQESETRTIKSITALPTFSVFNSVINLPKMSKKELNSAVFWEAKKVIPLPLEEMILDWKILNVDEKEENLLTEKLKKDDFVGRLPQRKDGQADLYGETEDVFNEAKEKKESKTDKGKYLKILLTGAPKDLVKRYMDIFRQANLNLLSLETEVFALIRSLVGNDKSVIMIVDIGALSTNISVVDNGVPFLNRSIDVGGATVTQAISSSLNIDFDQAEQFKYDTGLVGETEKIPQTIETILSPIINEIKYSFNLYQSQGLKNIEKIILTGGSSRLVNLPNYLSNLLNTRVYLGDPWARVVYPEELKPVLDEIGPRFGVAVGLAMRDIE